MKDAVGSRFVVTWIDSLSKDVGMSGPDLPDKKGVRRPSPRDVGARTRSTYLNSVRETGGPRRIDGVPTYERASGCLYFESVWTQHVVPALYVVRTVEHPSWRHSLPAVARDPARFPRSGRPNWT
jgi:hypothetical protein